ncbi:kinase interacting family protein [Striga asiatica]|uniref:Kinase interacting family protein n=1 Tax=Striga asiatica TaxID=4170 RepID=A0A5A7NY83_STRAF|nr:kinase interacting family protein [Striga asiatica]
MKLNSKLKWSFCFQIEAQKQSLWIEDYISYLRIAHFPVKILGIRRIKSSTSGGYSNIHGVRNRSEEKVYPKKARERKICGEMREHLIHVLGGITPRSPEVQNHRDTLTDGVVKFRHGFHLLHRSSAGHSHTV